MCSLLFFCSFWVLLLMCLFLSCFLACSLTPRQGLSGQLSWHLLCIPAGFSFRGPPASVGVTVQHHPLAI